MNVDSALVEVRKILEILSNKPALVPVVRGLYLLIIFIVGLYAVTTILSSVTRIKLWTRIGRNNEVIRSNTEVLVKFQKRLEGGR